VRRIYGIVGDSLNGITDAIRRRGDIEWVHMRHEEAAAFAAGAEAHLTGESLTNPDFAAMARAIGVHAIRVEDPGELEAAIAEALAHDGPALLDVLTNPQELAMPPTITLEQVEGFSLWALRAVINGRGDEVIEVAKTNLLR
jgi:thiamine pyrophosphate-dependent acetolactate synthase large subunit-like protein